MIKPVFFSESGTVTATVNHFAKVPFPYSKGLSVTVDRGGVVGGTPVYTLCVCNFNGDESDFVNITDATNIALTSAIKSSSFEFAYLGIKYTSNNATGIVQIYLNILN